jgi:flagellar basal body-associated protein FliL
MDRPEEKQESLQGDDHGEGSADPASADGAELKNKTDKSPDPETLLEDEPQGDSVPEATIILEDATPPKGPSEPEKNLEESKPLTEGSIEIEAEAASDHVSLPEAVEKGYGPGVFWWLKNHQKAVGSVFIGLCVLFLVYGVGRVLTCRHGKHQRMPSVQVYWSPVEEGASDILNFDRFLVLLPKTDEATYLLLKISVKPSNPAVYEEMNEKRTFCRASIYAALNKEVNSNKRQRISMKTLKPDIMEALNSALVTGTIAAIYFTEFLVV